MPPTPANSLLCRPGAAFAWLALLLNLAPVAAAVELELNGVTDPAIQRQLRDSLGAPPTQDNAQQAYLRTLQDRALRALQAIGFYGATVDYRIRSEEDTPIIAIDVELGDPVLIKAINLLVEGEAQSDPVFAELLSNPDIVIGDRLDHGRYEALKQRLLEIAQRRGYFKAALKTQRVEVSLAERSATIDLTLASGVRHVFGDITFDESPIDAAQLPRWLPFSSGTPYHTDLVALGTNSLRNTGYFTSVRLLVRREDSVDGRVPIHVALTPAAPNNVGFGLGFATDTGPRARATWDKPYVNDAGHSLRSEITASEVRGTLGASYRIPSEEIPARRYYQLEAALRAEDFEDTESTSRNLAARRVTDEDDGWRQDVYIRAENESFRIGDESETSGMLIPGINYSRLIGAGAVQVDRGARYSIRFEAASDALLSDVEMQKIVLAGKWLEPILPGHRLILRAEAGAVSTNDFDRLPSSERFYTGGDQSVRGFDYRAISPEDSDGNLTGGRFLNVASVEYVWQLNDSWALALFSDAGRAFNDRNDRFSVGAGFGVRWFSPIGIVRTDIGFAMSEDGDPARLHLTIGPDL